MPDQGEQRARPAGVRVREVRAAGDRFLATGHLGRHLRPLVAESWRRSLDRGVDPEHALAPVDLQDAALGALRDRHPLADVMPVIRRLLVEDAHDTGLLVAVSDAAGRLLWVEGPPRLRARAERIHFVEGAVWSEEAAGTNAPGTALALDRPVAIWAAEHLARPVAQWSCSAAPIHDPDTGAVLGALDITGGDDVAAPRALSVVRATVAAVETELRLLRLTGRRTGIPGGAWHGEAQAASGTPSARLAVLGVGTAVLEHAHGTSRLGGRHAELLVLLAASPEGLAGGELAALVLPEDRKAVTLRAELSRLRGVLGPVALEARPYRLGMPVTSDADEVRTLLRAGRVGPAVERYRGPLLPSSDAPGVVRMRDALHEELRAALLRCGDPDALLRFADTAHGRLDHAVWSVAVAVLDRGSPRRASALAHLAHLGRELA
ncbi:MAG TPA: transcriptional regulator [Dermatophilaceae bacterium]|nr:transcriptional regulator [Dermatophilaceae bacterium]